MGETIMLILVLLLALYGCMELIRRAAVRIMRPSGPRSGILVLPLSGHCGDVEYQIRAAASQNGKGLRRLSFGTAGKIAGTRKNVRRPFTERGIRFIILT